MQAASPGCTFAASLPLLRARLTHLFALCHDPGCAFSLKPLHFSASIYALGGRRIEQRMFWGKREMGFEGNIAFPGAPYSEEEN